HLGRGRRLRVRGRDLPPQGVHGFAPGLEIGDDGRTGADGGALPFRLQAERRHRGQAVGRPGAAEAVEAPVQVPERAGIRAVALQEIERAVELVDPAARLAQVDRAQLRELVVPVRGQGMPSTPLSSRASVMGSKGLVSTPAAPSALRRSTSVAMALAVRNTTGMAAVAGSSRKRASVEGPSRPGIMTSSRTASGWSSFARASASVPFVASTTS